MSLTHDTLLGGRIRYTQPAHGYRTGIEPVLLAASIPARPGERVLEAGTGAGAGLLCLAARVPGVIGVGLERDPDQANLAAINFAENAFPGLTALQADLLTWRAAEAFDHAFANPPWHSPQASTSPIASRAAAKTSDVDGLTHWIQALARLTKPRGSLSLILPGASLAAGISALTAATRAEIHLLPFWPRRNMPAKLIILQAVRGGKGPCIVGPGLVLHEDDGAYTVEADAMLRAVASEV